MKLLLKLAWRNIWRNKRRSALTIIAVVFATFLTLVQRGIQIGTYELNIKTVVELFSGYMQVQKEGFQKNPSLNKSFTYNSNVINALNSSGITNYTPRIYADGLISFKDNSTGAVIFGIDPQKEKRTTKILSKINEGKNIPSDSSDKIIIGNKLLDNLKANIGDTIVVLSQGFDGSLGNKKFIISGTLKTGASDLDGMSVFMGIKTAQELLGMHDQVNVISISLNELDDIKIFRPTLKQELDNQKLVVLAWDEVNPDLFQAVQLDNISGILFLGILLIIVAFGILNTVLMSVTERFREFGVTLAIGMPSKKLVLLVFLETFFIAVIGIIIGNIIGYFINQYLIANPIVFSGDYAALYEEYGFLPRLESVNRFKIFINTSVSVFVISMLASIYPAYKVYKLEPLKGIRHT